MSPILMPEVKNLSAVLARIEKQLGRHLNARDRFVRYFINHITAARGKRLRAQLTVLAARVCGKVDSRVEHLAAAMEIFHHATLIHDDIIDQAERRRGRPSLNHRFSNEVSVMVGDLMFTQVMNILIRDMPERVQKIAANTASRVCIGEIQELRLRTAWQLTVNEYLAVIANKTASLFAGCCEGGAVLTGAPDRRTAKLKQYGRALGMAYQIRDDLLDLTGQTSRLGKTVGTDLKTGRITLPVILGLKRCRGEKRKQLLRKLRAGKYPQKSIFRTLKACGALEATRAMSEAYAEQARKALLSLPDSPDRQALISLARFAWERDN